MSVPVGVAGVKMGGFADASCAVRFGSASSERCSEVLIRVRGAHLDPTDPGVSDSGIAHSRIVMERRRRVMAQIATVNICITCVGISHFVSGGALNRGQDRLAPLECAHRSPNWRNRPLLGF